MGRWSYSELKTYGLPARPKQAPRIFKGKAAKEITEKIAESLDIWRFSAFEHEGATVAGLRSALCLVGYSWAQSDREARVLVEAALKLNGSVRPTWEEGQLEYVVEVECCKWCRADITDLQAKGKKGARFCSEECASAFLLRRRANEEIEQSEIVRAARDLAYRRSVGVRPCEECGKDFKPWHESKSGRFCSLFCYHEADRKRQATVEVACQCCGSRYLSKVDRPGLCSKKCKLEWANRRRRDKRRVVAAARPPKVIEARYEKTCPCCQVVFMAKSKTAVYCGPKCYARMYNAKRESRQPKGVVIALTPRVFDEWFAEAA